MPVEPELDGRAPVDVRQAVDDAHHAPNADQSAVDADQSAADVDQMRSDGHQQAAGVQARLLDLAHDAIIVRDPDSHIIFWSKGAEETYGWTATEARGQLAYELLRTIFPTTHSAVDDSLEDAGDWKGELVHTARDGRKLTVESRQSVDRDAQGRVRAILEINRDVSERKAADEYLAHLEGRYRGLLESAPDAMVVVNPAGEIVLVNNQAERQFGYQRHELAGQLVELLVPQRLHGRHVENRDRYREAPRRREMGTGSELVGRRKDHSEFPVEIMLSPTESPEGTLITATIRDISLRVAAEQEHSRLASAVEQAADSISMHGLDGIVTYVNPAFTRAYGYEPQEIVGRHGAMIDSGHHEPAFFEAIRASAAASRTWSGTIVNRRKDGTSMEVEAVISAIQDADGRVESYVQVDRDVTHERELERALERHAREREAIETALARIDPAESAEEIAAAACAVINGLPGVDSTWAAVLDGAEGAVLAATGRLAPTFGGGRPIPATRVEYLCERGSGGAWFEEWRPRADDGAWSEAVTSTGLRAMAYAPLRSPRGVVGVVGIGSHDPLTSQSLVEHVPALATFASILGAQLVPKLEGRRRDAEARSEIREVLDASAFGPFFQPIVDLHSGAVVGYEALTRFADHTPPDARFAAAARVGLEIELETATLRAALAAAAAVLPPKAYLSLNASPALIGSTLLRPLLAGLVRPIALEITEHVAIDDYVALRAELATLGPNVRLAVDDAGAGYASFRHILELTPDLVKLDMGLIRGINADPARQALVAGMAHFAARRKIRLVAEGIETLAELETLRSLAIHYGQGYLLGRPQDGRGPGPWTTSIAIPAS